MSILKKIKSHPNVVDYFKELPFYKKYIEKPKVTCLKSVVFLSELSFLWRTECNKNKSCIKRLCNELQSRISWEKRSNWTVRSK